MAEGISLDPIRERQKKLLLQVFQDRQETKSVLVVHSSLMSLLRYAIGADDILEGLKEQRVVRVLQLSSSVAKHVEAEHKVVFMVPSRLPVLTLLSDVLRELGPKVAKIDVRVVPRLSLIAEHFLEARGVRGVIKTLKELELDLIVHEDGVLSMELDDVANQLLVQEDTSILYSTAKALTKLQVQYGRVKQIRGKGESAVITANIISHMKTEVEDLFEGQSSCIHTVFLFDRKLDLLTPLLTTRTYEGYLDGLYGIRNHKVQVPIELSTGGSTLDLAGEDKVYPNIRFTNFTVVRQQLNRRARWIQDRYAERNELKTITEIRDFTKKIKSWKAEEKDLSTHIDVCNHIYTKEAALNTPYRDWLEYEKSVLLESDADVGLEYVEEKICTCSPLEEVLRAIALYSHATGGLKGRLHAQWKGMLVQMYGPKAILLWQNLERAGLLLSSRGPFHALRDALNLVNTEASLADPSDMYFAYGGYTPLIPRIVDIATTKNDWQASWSSLSGPFSQLPGGVYSAHNELDIVEPGKPRVILVFFLGGVTRGEIAALRYLEEKSMSREETEGPALRIIIATTSVLSPKTCVASLSGLDD